MLFKIEFPFVYGYLSFFIRRKFFEKLSRAAEFYRRETVYVLLPLKKFERSFSRTSTAVAYAEYHKRVIDIFALRIAFK